MAYRFKGQILYVRHLENEVRNEDWDDLMRDIEGHLATFKYIRVLVVTDHAGPSATQRSRLNALISSRKANMRVAVLSTSVLVRGIITAFSWARIVDIRSFNPGDYDGAIRYLEAPNVTPEDAARALAELAQ